MVNPPALGGAGAGPSTAAKAPAQSRMGGSAMNMAPPAFPYSARRADELKLSTVERKGHPSTRNLPLRTRPHGLLEAPTFRPTEAEFRDPMKYLRSIHEQGSKFGICKVVPPDNWNPDFAIDTTVCQRSATIVLDYEVRN
jgi:[histone H3]-trimethyl-L-lysine4 demethylase